MTETIVISFYPKHADMSEEEHEAAIETYRNWLDQHGRYGKLYMMNIGKMGVDGAVTNQSVINGIRIFEPEIATLFKLTFEV